MAQNIFIFICSKESISAKKIYLQYLGGGGGCFRMSYAGNYQIYMPDLITFLKKI